MLLDYIAGEGGLALLDVNPGLVIWTFIAFLIVLFILAKFAWGPIVRALDERADRIHSDIDRADKLRADAEAKLQEYMQKLDGLREEGQDIIHEANEDARKLKDEILKEARHEAEAVKKRALHEVELARDDVLDQIHRTIVEVATNVAGKIMERSLKPEDHSKLVEDTIKQMGSLN